MEDERTAKSIVLLPHQEQIKRRAIQGDIHWPFYLAWAMGSGKSFGALAALYALDGLATVPRALVVCPLSLVEQWKAAILRFYDHVLGSPPRARVTVAHYEQLDRGEVTPRKFDLCVVDEAARFRNAFRADDAGRTRPALLAYEIGLILQCPRILYLSGTPYLADPQVELAAFQAMMRVSDDLPLMRRVSIYDPRHDPQFMKRIATRQDVTVEVPMLLSQTLLYFLFKSANLTLHVDGAAPLRATLETGNAFEAQLIKICNNPFTRPKFEFDEPEMSPKIVRLVETVEALLATAPRGRKQLVYSCRKGEGVEQIRFLLTARALSRLFATEVSWHDVAATRASKSPLPAAVARKARELLSSQFLLLSGDLTSQERDAAIRTFNRPLGKYRHSKVLCFTACCGCGVDLLEAGDIHLLEPQLVKAAEDQIVARGLRIFAHRHGHRHIFGCYTYVATFPSADAEVDDAFVDVLSFFGRYRHGPPQLSREELCALRDALFAQHIAPEGVTVDQKHHAQALARFKAITRQNHALAEFDPDGRALLAGPRQEQGWAARARELARALRGADDEARHAAATGDGTAEPGEHGWDGASRCAIAISFMTSWWANYLYEDFPGMYDLAWKRVRLRHSREGRKKLPKDGTPEADAYRSEVKAELAALSAEGRDVLGDRAFIRQVLGFDIVLSDVPAFKAAMAKRGFVVPTRTPGRGWTWASAERTYKVVPRPGQRGSRELLAAFEHARLAAVP